MWRRELEHGGLAHRREWPATGRSARAGAHSAGSTIAVGERTVTLVDRSRTIVIPGRGREPRTLVTVVRYPLHARGPFPLVVFGHGFAVTPRPYAPLLTAWARAGFVVAAPIFPLENAHAPGGPDESTDLINQPRDMSFVITRMLRAGAARHGFLAGLIDPRQIAVAGQSDGGETALAVAYDRHFIDRRVAAAVILSGAEIPGVGGFDFPSPSPPLLASQGTADPDQPATQHDHVLQARSAPQVPVEAPRRRSPGPVHDPASRSSGLSSTSASRSSIAT